MEMKLYIKISAAEGGYLPPPVVVTPGTYGWFPYENIQQTQLWLGVKPSSAGFTVLSEHLNSVQDSF